MAYAKGTETGFQHLFGITLVLMMYVNPLQAESLENFFAFFSPIQIPDNIDENRFHLGQWLFEDKNLPGSKNISCSRCHSRQYYGTGNEDLPRGDNGQLFPRNTPSILNGSLSYLTGWSGKLRTVLEHTNMVMQDPMEMGGNWPTILDYLSTSPSYKALFHQVYQNKMSKKEVLDALDDFQDNLVSPAPFDRFLLGDEKILKEEQQQGFLLFNHLGCSSYHNGCQLGGGVIQPFGVFEQYTERNMGIERYRVPSLRNVSKTVPYFHDGREPELTKAIQIIAQYQVGRDLNEEQIVSLATFLGSLTSDSSLWGELGEE